MSFIEAFGHYVPARVIGNEELGAELGCDAAWIESVCGIVQRRYAADGEGVVEMAVAAARDCLLRAGADVASVDMLIVSSGSSERRFPGPAASVAHALGMNGAPALDVPLASAGSIFALSIASRLNARVLVIAAEKMSAIIRGAPLDRNTAILFGDGAGAALVNYTTGFARIIDSVLHSDGQYSDDLHLELTGPLYMNGRSVILQASRKLPDTIGEVLERNKIAPQAIKAFITHQANRNLMDRVASALGVSTERFFTNIARYGNTSSASMLIAASEWRRSAKVDPGDLICLAGFGAGFHWGAMLLEIVR